MANTRPKERANKSSIIRIILSNYDMEKIKELKVLYTKQGGVDTFNIQKMNCPKDSFIIQFKEVEPWSPKVKITYEADGSFIVEKYRTVEKKDSKPLRKYKISGVHRVYEKENKKTGQLEERKRVVVFVEDLLYADVVRKDKKRPRSKTERTLITRDIAINYGLIQKKSPDAVDSKSIYITKRFLEYRSKLLLYFNFIDNFLMTKVKAKYDAMPLTNRPKQIPNELWKLWKYDANNLADNLNLVRDQIEENISAFIKQYNNDVEHINKKRLAQNPSGKTLPTIDNIDSKDILDDVRKIVSVLSDLRHKLAHYEFDAFYKLFRGEGSVIKVQDSPYFNQSITQCLNLNIFKALDQIKDIREDAYTNYLEKGEKIRIFNRAVDAKLYHSAYRKICNRKNGFNAFINQFFAVDGVEDADFKALVNQQFEYQMKLLEEWKDTSKNHKKKNQLKKELDEMKSVKTVTGEAYAYDIHLCKTYKDLYKDHKDEVARQGLIIESGHIKEHKEELATINENLSEYNTQMKEITRLNAKYRLQYKMQVVFGFLMSEYDLNMQVFGNKFDKARQENTFEALVDSYTAKFKKNGGRYLRTSLGKADAVKDRWEEIEVYVEKMEDVQQALFENTPENDLNKLYMLLFLLLPKEIRGDFLGYAKSHYYDLKNVDFLASKSDDNVQFFHRMRLFEKNTKHFEIINYSLSSYADFETDMDLALRSMGIHKTIHHKWGQGDKTERLFDKSVIMPLWKYYQRIFDLCNKAEIHGLLLVAHKENLNMEQAIKRVSGKHLNFKDLMYICKHGKTYRELNKGVPKKNRFSDDVIFKFCSPRNNIAHLNYRELFTEVFTPQNGQNSKKKKTLIQQSEDIIKGIDHCGLNDINLGMDMKNDFYMSLDRLLFRQKKTEVETDKPTRKEFRKEVEEETLKKYSLNRADFEKEETYGRQLEALRKCIERMLNLIENDYKQATEEYGHIEVCLKNKKVQEISALDWKAKKKNKVLIKKELDKEASDLLGIYKKYCIRTIRLKLTKVLTDGATNTKLIKILGGKGKIS